MVVLGLLALSACGSAYKSSQVPQDNDSVRIVPLSVSSAEQANRSKYRPRQLPAVFFQNAGGGGALRGAGAAPEPSLDPQRRPAAMTLRLPPALADEPYRIGVGDVLLLATKAGGNTVEQLSGLLAAQNRRQGYTVQDDGAIAIPDVGRVEVSGLTLEEVEAALFDSLVRNQIDPSFSIEIAEFNSKRVSIGGAVKNPSVVPIRLTPLRLSEALSAAGGINTKDQDFATIRLYRDGGLYQIPLRDYLARADLQSLRLTANDSLFIDTAYQLDKAQAYFTEQITLSQFRQQARVQALNELQAEVNLRRAALTEERDNFRTRLETGAIKRDYVYLAGEVTKPARFPLPFEHQASLADALYSDGGFSSETGDPTQIYVLRATPTTDDPNQVTALHLDARNAANLVLTTRLEMRPNDVIFVAEQPVTRWNRVVQQLVPTLLSAGVTAATQ
ncbi:MAG: polysaccharide biosynthesis/export family protein [Roseovarius sp.]|nr:polysaccharide biosynthesis/export family protein [Roseovarius sp.]